MRGHAALYMAPTLVQSILPLITMPIFTRALSREEYGAWGIATAVAALVSGSVSLGVQAGYDRNYFAAADDTLRGRLLYSVMLFAIGAQLGGLVIVVAVGPFVASRLLHAPELSYLFVLAFLVAAIGALKMFLLTTLRNEGRAAEYVRYSVDELVLGAVLAVIAVVWLGYGVAGMLAGPLIATSIVTTMLAVRMAARIELVFAKEQLADALRVALPLAPRILIGSVGNQLDRLVLGAVGSLASVGVYTVGQRIAQLVFAFMTALQNVYQPVVYRMLFAAAPPAEIGRYLLPFAYASVGVAVGAILFSREIVALAVAPEYAGAAIVLAILAMYYALLFFGKQPQLMFARRAGLVSLLSVLTVAVNALAVYAGARLGGPAGAAIGLLSAGILTGAIALVMATRYAPIAYPAGQTTLAFLALPAALAVTLALPSVVPGLLPRLAIQMLMFAAYVVAGWRGGMLRAAWEGATGPAR